jgi:hypothetical protein
MSGEGGWWRDEGKGAGCAPAPGEGGRGGRAGRVWGEGVFI